MEKPPGHTAESNTISPALSSRRIRLALILVATAGVLIWSGLSGVLKKESPHHQHTPTHTHRMKSTAAHDRDRPSLLSRSPREDSQPGASGILLPQPIEQYLDATDDGDAEKLHAFVHEHIAPDAVDNLILRYHMSDSGENTHRIITLLSDLKSPDTLSHARSIISQSSHEPDSPILLACAASLAKNGGQDSIQAILERLNREPMDDSGDVPENSIPLINTLALASAPELEWFIGQAAEGKWIATNTASRMAAITALRSYPNIHTTSILARLRNRDEPRHIRELASDVMDHIQQQDSD